MAIRRTTKTALLAATALALLPALSACAGGQSVADACSIVEDGTAELNSSLTDISSSVTGGDSDALTEQVAAVDSEISAIGDEITNEEVKTSYDAFAAAFSDLTSQLQGMADIDVTDTDAVTEATEAMTASSTDLQNAQADLTDTCGF
ncbi:hypothetical protein N8K70_08240 [Microbacterium betulae]|uniref:Uncharacterized protein n=1 Tax=Microbacterium betulae TaxID=2981139 RepID=A0AA97FKF9_9MICO|nr:hypothetical protein [Microbacterium sp. AB]WOF24628.1 hypothetical protein N8K70_08240 [Microbacterium sp. AB]